MQLQKILMAEDSVFDQLIVEKTLKSKYDLQIVNNGQELIDLYSIKNFDAILTDLEMPIIDGYEATYAIRNNFSSVKKNVPIIATSSSSPSQEDLQKFKFTGFIPKPLNPNLLIDIFNKSYSTIFKFSFVNLEPLNYYSNNDRVYIIKNINLFLNNINPIIRNLVSSFKQRDFIKFNVNAQNILKLSSFFTDEKTIANLKLLANPRVLNKCTIYEINDLINSSSNSLNEVVLYLKNYIFLENNDTK